MATGVEQYSFSINIYAFCCDAVCILTTRHIVAGKITQAIKLSREATHRNHLYSTHNTQTLTLICGRLHTVLIVIYILGGYSNENQDNYIASLA